MVSVLAGDRDCDKTMSELVLMLMDMNYPTRSATNVLIIMSMMLASEAGRGVSMLLLIRAVCLPI